MTLQSMARIAVTKLAMDVYSGVTGLWPKIDAIERRFKIQGCAECLIDSWCLQKRQAQKKLADELTAKGIYFH